MWLLNAKTCLLEQVADRDLEEQQGSTGPRYRYGILSHRWEDEVEEPTFEEYRADRPPVTKKGVRKIEECCRVAQEYGLGLVWSDTCCIDKRSSAVLQEAINSMYSFYERADICFAYLRDVRKDDLDDTFVKSEWFTRGWTLQELLAPSEIHFYDGDWNRVGDKTSLSHLIFAATGIQTDVLTGKTKLRECSVAQRMSWAADRTTTRVEDLAYSLLGIFDVNLTMLYGEGRKAFMRLQEEIIRTLDDHSIFVWRGLQPGQPGLLASSPAAFASSGNVRNIRDRQGRGPYMVNNRGVHGLVPLIAYTLDTYLTLLPCTDSDPAGQPGIVGIFLRRLYEDNQFMRVSVRGEELLTNATAWVLEHGVNRMVVARNISIRQSLLPAEEQEYANIERIQGFQLSGDLLKEDSTSHPLFSIPQFSISGEWDSENRIASLPPGSRKIHHVGAIDVGLQKRDIEVIRFGYDHDYNPVVFLTRKGVRYSWKEDHRGVFMESFKEPESPKDMDPLMRLVQARLLSPGENFQAASPALGGHWSQIREMPDGASVAQMSEDVDGFWALKADRLDGLDVYLIKRPQQLGKSNENGCVGRVRLRRVLVDKRLVWNLHLQLDQASLPGVYQSGEESQAHRSHAHTPRENDIKKLTSLADDLLYEGRKM